MLVTLAQGITTKGITISLTGFHTIVSMVYSSLNVHPNIYNISLKKNQVINITNLVRTYEYM